MCACFQMGQQPLLLSATKDTEKPEVLNVFLALVLPSNMAFKNGSHAPESSQKVWSKGNLTLARGKSNSGTEYTHANGVWWIQPGAARELLSVTARPCCYFWKVAMPPLSLVFLNTQQDKALTWEVPLPWHRDLPNPLPIWMAPW